MVSTPSVDAWELHFAFYPSTPFSLSISWRIVLFLHVYLVYVCCTCGSLHSSEEGIRTPETRVTSSSEPPEGSSENQTHFIWKVIKCSEQVNHLSGPNFFLKLFFHLHLRRKSAAAITTLLLGSWRDKYESLIDHISLYIQDSTGLNLLFCPLLCLNSALIWMNAQAYYHSTYLTMMRDAD